MATSPADTPAEQPADEAPLGAKHELATRPADLIDRVPLSRAVGPYVLSDDEIRRTYRLASALAASGMFKDAKQAEVAFAKILIGQDLGISATRALSGLDIVKGNVQMRGVLLLAFVRESRRYDYKIIELDGETELPGKTPAEVEAQQRATIRFFEVLPDGSKEALTPDVTFTMAMARKQGNVKPDSAWFSARRNMLLWRAASDGVKFHCPDLLGGIPVYTEADSFPPALSEGTGDGEARGLDLGPEVDAVIARATELGHAALADRAAIEIALGDQPPAKVVAWVKAATVELDAVPVDAEVVGEEASSCGSEAGAARGSEDGPEQERSDLSPAGSTTRAAEAVVRPDDAQAADGLRDTVPAPEAPDTAPEAAESAAPTDDEQRLADDLGVAIESQGFLDDGPPRRAEPRAADDPERIAALRRRGEELLADAEALRDNNDPRADEVFEEFERIAAEVGAAGNVDQGSLPL